MSRELSLTEQQTALVPQRDLTPAIWDMINGMAPVMHGSRLFGVASKEAAAAIMLKGHELGLGITASFEFIQVIQGKPGLSPRGALALLLNHPQIERIDIKRLPETGPFIGYECFMRRRNGFEHRARFCLEDARRAGLVKAGSGWENYPENMCLWRAVGFCADVVAPDITAGMTSIMKMPEQFGVSLSEEGDVIDSTATLIPANGTFAQDTTQALNLPTVSLDELLETYGAEIILVANEGRIPGTDTELAAVAAKLAS